MSDRAALLDALATLAEATVKTPTTSNAARYAFAPLAARTAHLAQDLASDKAVGANEFAPTMTLRDIHVELADLNREAAQLTARIQENFDEIL